MDFAAAVKRSCFFQPVELCVAGDEFQILSKFERKETGRRQIKFSGPVFPGGPEAAVFQNFDFRHQITSKTCASGLRVSGTGLKPSAA